MVIFMQQKHQNCDADRNITSLLYTVNFGSSDWDVHPLILDLMLLQHLQKKYSYLDIIGRTVVVLEKRNVVPEHHVPFQVT